MPKFAANLHYLFTELPFLERFAAAAAAGFRAVEFQVPYDYAGAELKARLDAHGLEMVLFDAPMGDWNAGDRGLAAVPGREAEFRVGLNRALDYAAKSTDPSAQLWRAERRKRYDGIPVRRIEAVCVYDHAFDDFTLRTSVTRSYTSCPYRATHFCASNVPLLTVREIEASPDATPSASPIAHRPILTD